ncbi:MAG: cell wall metabolism sensor histidine kinase WalK [Chloroflexi bacterium]|nr:cell wall metabolism sensor histidine kinase WalK [Chloroflexota bacterium]
MANVPSLLATYQLRQLEFLLRISRAMASRLDLPSLLELILRSAAEMVGAPAGMILLQSEHTLFDPALAVTPQFQVRALYAIPTEALHHFEPLLDASAMRLVQEAVAAAAESPPVIDLGSRVHLVEEELDTVLGQVVALPLLFEEELLGLIYLFRSNYAFSQLDWQFLQGFADQAAVAVRNARLYTLLSAERSRLFTILSNSAEGILILTRDRIVVAINQALASMVGMAPEDAVGRPCSAVLPLESVSGTDFCRDESYKGQFSEPNLHSEGVLIRPGDKRLVLAVTYTPLYTESGRLINIIVNVHDITRFREEEEMKSTFTSIISHELKTPVALIKGYAQTLARPDARWDAETSRSSLQIIEEEADRLEGLIDNLLDASRIQAQGLKLDFADVDLEHLLRRLAEAYRTQTQNHRIEVVFDNSLPSIWGDEERLRQLFTNLLSNAIKYSPQGGAIRVGGWLHRSEAPEAAPLPGNPLAPLAAGDFVVIYVADHGIGIPASDLPRIFDRYYRVDSTLRRSTAGAGLGLYLARTIVEAHGGQIWATSEQGKGTTFFVALPLDTF